MLQRYRWKAKLDGNLTYFLIPLFAIFGPFFQALDALHISVWHQEVLILAGLLIGFSLLLTTALLTGGERLRILILAAIALAMLDVIFGGGKLKDFLIEDNWAISKQIRKVVFNFVLLACLGIIYLVLWTLRQHVKTILGTIFAAIFLTTLILHPVLLPARFFSSSKAMRPPDSKAVSVDLPIVVHLVFDELMAPGAMAVREEAGTKVAKAMMDFSDRFKFRLYGRVYSRHYFTVDSLGSTFNYDLTGLKTSGKDTDETNKRANAYFDEMAKRGYEIRVYQSAHLDFCAHSAVAVCETLDSFNPLSEYVNSDAKKLRNVAGTILSAFADSYTYRKIAGWLRKLTGDWPSRYDVQAFPQWFEKLSGEITRAPRGTMIFAHILVPHAPHMLNENCELNENELNPYDLGERGGLSTQAANSRTNFYVRYFEQVECVHKQLEKVLQKLENSDRFKDATIVIHGDHGSRISLSHHLETMSQDDFVDNYPAYFSIRGPGIEPGYDPRFVSLQKLFAEYFGPERVRTGGQTHEGLVVVQSKDPKEVVEVEMPIFGATQ